MNRITTILVMSLYLCTLNNGNTQNVENDTTEVNDSNVEEQNTKNNEDSNTESNETESDSSDAEDENVNNNEASNTAEENTDSDEITDDTKQLFDNLKESNAKVADELGKFKSEIEEIIKNMRNDPEYKKDDANGAKVSTAADNIVKNIGSASELFNNLNIVIDAINQMKETILQDLDTLKAAKLPDKYSLQFRQAFQNIQEKINEIYSNMNK